MSHGVRAKMIAELQKLIPRKCHFLKNVSLVGLGMVMILVLFHDHPYVYIPKGLLNKTQAIKDAVFDQKSRKDGMMKDTEEEFEKEEWKNNTRFSKTASDLHSKATRSYGNENINCPEGVNMTIEEDTRVTFSAANVTPPDARVMIYNRVPKCGSTTTQALLMRMVKRNKFIYKSSRTYDKHRLDIKQQKAILASLYRETTEGAQCYNRHMYYFNVSRFGYPRPVMVNLIRDPVDRFISNFYYVRSNLRWKSNWKLKSNDPPPKSWFEKKLDTCIGLGDPECLPVQGKLRELQLSYFCGHHPGCLQVGNQGALQRAKRHVENYYSVVALLEEYLLSFKVLEEYVPRFFANVTSEKMSSGTIKRKTTFKPPVSNSTKNLLRNILKEDMEFYDFAKQRLHKQANALGIL
ncbi:heparan sulfate 2-O-sulfotransferase hst-2-like [Oratosquilla oratoria]|uniref:heparan sulfate 2-O-sulfotransferase hst-2-like n=1 Tax=Oratosquilla oratoria TaxID=337810 RepID=UPI003F75AF7E